MALNQHLDNHLKQSIGSGNYTVTNMIATLPTASMSQAQLITLLDVARVADQQVILNAGVITVKPRQQ